MGRRAAAVESTRGQILDAALDLYREQGLAKTTLAQVAERADVARATVINHFGSGEGLVSAAIDRIAESLDLPTPAIFAGAASPVERVHRLVTAMFTLYERSEGWFDAIQADIQATPAAARREQRFWTEIGQLHRAALRPRRGKRRLLATIAAMTSPETFSAFKTAGLSTREAIEVASDLIARVVVDKNTC